MIKINQVKKIDDEVSKFLFKLRNKIYVRKNSIDESIITTISHKLWIKKFLNEKNKLYIIFKNSRPIGYIRLEFLNSFYNTSWALYKKYHNKGYAKKSLIYATRNKNYHNWNNLIGSKIEIKNKLLILKPFETIWLSNR